MDSLLRLPASTEAQYWASTNAQFQVQLGDVMGVTTGILFNMLAASHALKRVAMVYYSVVVFSQVFQFVWLLRRPQSYMRKRYLVTLLQRVRVTAVTTIALVARPSDQWFSPTFHKWELQTPEGRCRAFLAIAFGWGFLGLMMGLNHALPFRSQALFAVYTFLAHSFIWMQHQVRAIDRHGLEDWAQSTCNVMELTFWGPMLARKGNLIGLFCNGALAKTMVASQGVVIFACHAPLLLVYWLEYTSKASFLRAAGLPGPAPRMSWLSILLYFWAMCAASWGLLFMLHSHVDVFSVFSVPHH